MRASRRPFGFVALLGASLILAGTTQAADTLTTNAAQSPIQVTTRSGTLHGVALDNGSVVFRAIPYAAPPLGVLRWQPPQPAPHWSGVREATAAAAPCVQPALGWNDTLAARGKEDCLYLEVETPSLTPASPQPVIVWIHGGANVAGAGGNAPSALAREGVVLVSVQYRLGVFGFLSLPELRGGLPQRAAGNFALLDQIAALRWVRDNIARFGGDPQRVTIAGQSAGAQDVGLLMLSPLARGLFSGAIEQSGTAGFGLPARSLAEQRALGETIARRAGIGPGRDRLARLRTLPAERLLEAGQGVDVPALDDDGYIWLQAMVDGEVLPAAPAELLARGQQAPVPLLIGSNALELELGGGEAGALARLRRDYPAHVVDEVQTLEARDPAPRYGTASQRLANDLTFRCPALRVAQAQVARDVPVWHYEFDQAALDAQVAHSAELPFVFKALPLGGGAGTLTAYWAAFARRGDPNVEGAAKWPGYASKRESLRFTPEGGEIATDLRGEVCGLLDRP
jgi:para-nitrobenzyl esterase